MCPVVVQLKQSKEEDASLLGFQLFNALPGKQVTGRSEFSKNVNITRLSSY